MPLRASLNTSHSLSPANPRASACCKQLPVVYTRKPHIKSDTIWGARPYSMLGARRLTRLMMPPPFTSCISDNCAFVRLDVRRRKWLLPPFVRTTLPEPVRRKRLEVALWVFSLFLPAFALRGIADFSFQTKYA